MWAASPRETMPSLLVSPPSAKITGVESLLELGLSHFPKPAVRLGTPQAFCRGWMEVAVDGAWVGDAVGFAVAPVGGVAGVDASVGPFFVGVGTAVGPGVSFVGTADDTSVACSKVGLVLLWPLVPESWPASPLVPP